MFTLLGSFAIERFSTEHNIINRISLDLNVSVLFLWAVGVVIADMFQSENIVVYYAFIFFFVYFIDFDLIKTSLFLVAFQGLLSYLLINYNNFTGVNEVLIASWQFIFFGILIRYYLYELNKRNFIQKKDLEDKSRKLQYLSYYDSLSGLLNRGRWESLYEDFYKEAFNKQEEISVMLMDIDYFKEYNDHYGHYEGDQIIKAVSDVLREVTLPFKGVLGRYGGDEFVYACKNDCSIEEIAEEINKEIRRTKLTHDKSKTSQYVSVSYGFTTLVPKDLEEKWQPIVMADQNLYKMKNNRIKKVYPAG
jgi:diguanylate cyclase (GGDEF)-like protein